MPTLAHNANFHHESLTSLAGWRYLPLRLPPSPRRSRVVNSCCRRASLPRAALSLSSSSVRPSGSGPGFVGFVIVARLAPQSAATAPPPPEVAGREMSQRTCWTVALCASSIVDVGQSPLPSSWSHCSPHACGHGYCMVRKTRDPSCTTPSLPARPTRTSARRRPARCRACSARPRCRSASPSRARARGRRRRRANIARREPARRGAAVTGESRRGTQGPCVALPSQRAILGGFALSCEGRRKETILTRPATNHDVAPPVTNRDVAPTHPVTNRDAAPPPSRTAAASHHHTAHLPARVDAHARVVGLAPRHARLGPLGAEPHVRLRVGRSGGAHFAVGGRSSAVRRSSAPP